MRKTDDGYILNDLVILIEKSPLINNDHMTAIAIILENPYLTNISIANITILLKILYSKLNQLNEQDINLNPKNNDFISLFKGMARILNLISEMSIEMNNKIIEEEFHKSLKVKLMELVSSNKNHPLVNFHAYYCL